MKNIGLAYDPRNYKPISYDVAEATKSERRREVQDVTKETPQTQSYVQYVPVVTKPDYKKIILVGGGIILFAILLKKVIR